MSVSRTELFVKNSKRQLPRVLVGDECCCFGSGRAGGVEEDEEEDQGTCAVVDLFAGQRR